MQIVGVEIVAALAEVWHAPELTSVGGSVQLSSIVRLAPRFEICVVCCFSLVVVGK